MRGFVIRAVTISARLMYSILLFQRHLVILLRLVPVDQEPVAELEGRHRPHNQDQEALNARIRLQIYILISIVLHSSDGRNTETMGLTSYLSRNGLR